MVTRRRRLPQLAAIDAMLSNIFILLCIYKLSPLIATGSASDWLWATSAAIVAAASAASTGAHARDEAQRPQANVEMQKAPTTIGVQPDDGAYVKPLLATPPVDGTFTPTAPGAWPDDDAQALAQPSLATPLVDGVHEPATHSRAVQQKTPDAQPFGARRAPPIYLDVTRMPLAELERITDPTPDPPATRIDGQGPARAGARAAPPTYVNPDDAVREFTRRVAAHFEHTNSMPHATPTGVAATLATTTAVLNAAPGAPACERRHSRPRGRRGGRRTRRARAVGVVAVHVGTCAAAHGARAPAPSATDDIDAADAEPEGADFLALLDAEYEYPGVAVTHAGTGEAVVDEEEAAEFLALIDSIDGDHGVVAMHAGVAATARGTGAPAPSATNGADEWAEDNEAIEYAAMLDGEGLPGMQLMLECMPGGVAPAEFFHYLINYISPDDQQRLIAYELPDHADVSAIDSTLGWHDSLAAAVVLRTSPGNEYDLYEILGLIPEGVRAVDYARTFCSLPPDMQESLVDGDTGNENHE